MVKNLPTIERSTRLRYGKNCLEDQAENTIVFNASNAHINANVPGSLYLSPIRFRTDYSDKSIVLLMYNKRTKEITESGEAATDIIETTLQGATLKGNVTANTSVFAGVDLNNKLSLLTANSVGIANLTPTSDYTLSVGSNVFIDDTSTTANLLTIIGDSDFRGNVVIDGNLHVNGTTTVFQVENIVVKDPILELGQNNDSPVTQLDLGLLLHRPEGKSNVAFVFNEENQEIMLGFTSNASTDTNIVPVNDLNKSMNVHVYGQLFTEESLGVVNTNPIHTLDVGSNLYVDDLSTNVLVVTGSTDVSNVLTIGNNTHIGNELHVENNTHMSRDLTVSGNTYTTGNIIGYQDLLITGNTYVSGNVTIDTELNAIGNVYMEKDLEITGNTYITGNTNITKILNVTNNVFAKRDLSITGNLYTSGNTHLYQGLHVTGNTLLYKDLTISGNVYATKNVFIDRQLHVDLNVYTYKDLLITGNVFGSSNLNVTKNLNVTSNAILKKDLLVTGNTYVTGNVYLSKDVEISGNTYTDGNVVAYKDLTLSGNAYIDGNVNAYKDLLLTGNAYVTGNVNVTDQLNVTGNVYLSKDIEIEGNNYVTGNVVATRDISANKYYGDGGHLSNVTLQVVTDHSNVTSNTLHFTNAHTAFVTDLTSNVEIKLDQLNNVTVQTPLESQYLIYQDEDEWINDYPGQTFLKIYNATADTIYAGNAVYIIQQHNPNVVEVGLADARDPDKMPCIGLVWETSIAPGGEGHATTFGKSQAFKTSQFLEGETLYVSNVYAGMLSNVKPYGIAGNVDKIQNVGICSRVHQSSGRVTVTGIGRSNDIPNANIVTSNATVNYVYVNTANNDMKKIDPMKLPTKLQTLRDVVNTGNVVSNAISVTGLHVTNGGNVISSGNVQAGANVSIAGLGSKHLPYVSESKYLKDSFIRQEADGRIVIAADLEVDGSVTVSGSSFEVTAGELVVSDRIIDISNGAVTHDLDSGILIEHPGHNIGLIHHGDTDTFSMGYTQNGYADSHILEDSNIFTLDVIGNVVVQNTITIESGDLIVSQGNAYFNSNITVSRGLEVSGNISTTSELRVAGNTVISGNTNVTGYAQAHGMILGPGGLKIGNLFSAGPGAVPGVGSVSITGVVQALAFRTAHDSGYNTGIANTSPDHTFSVGANAYINAYGDRTLSITGNTFTTNLFATSNIGINIPANENPGYSLDVRGTSNVATLNVDRTTAATDKTTGSLIVAGGVGISGALYGAAATFDGVTSITNATAATGKTDGALVVTGGTGISGALYGAAATFDGVTSVTNGTAATNKTSGALVVTGGTGISGALYGATASFDGVTSVTNATAATGKTDGALVVTGGAGISGDIYAADATFDNLSVAADTDMTAIIGRARFGQVKATDQGGFSHYDMTGSTEYAVAQNASGRTFVNAKTGQGLYFMEEGSTKMILSDGNFGIGETSPSTKLHVAGGTIINSDAVAKKTYSYSGTISATTQPYINVNFTNYSFTAMVVAQLIESDEEISTIKFECCGGNKSGSAPSVNIVPGTVSVFGPTSTNPWSVLVVCNPTRVGIIPTGVLDVDGEYNIFIEYISANSSGGVSSIDEDVTEVAAFSY